MGGFSVVVFHSAICTCGIATGYELDGRDSIPCRGKTFLHSVQTGCVATQPSVQWVPGALSLEVKRQGHEADHSPPSNAEVKNGGAIPPVLHMSSWHNA
jgi:hypothetical protein